MWSRVAARGANLRRMANANADSEGTRLTRGVVRSVMAKSRAGRGCEHPGGGAGASSSALADDGGSEDEMVCELEQEMSQAKEGLVRHLCSRFSKLSLVGGLQQRLQLLQV